MKSKVLIFTPALLAFATACSTTAKLDVRDDKFSGGRVALTDPQPLVDKPESTESCGSVSVCIAFKKIIEPNRVRYEAVVTDGSEFNRPVDATKTDSLSLNVDGEITNSSAESDGKSSEVKGSGFLIPVLRQQLLYTQVPEQLIVAMSSAKEVKIRLRGMDREKSGYLRPITIEAVRNLSRAQ